MHDNFCNKDDGGAAETNCHNNKQSIDVLVIQNHTVILISMGCFDISPRVASRGVGEVVSDVSLYICDFQSHFQA